VPIENPVSRHRDRPYLTTNIERFGQELSIASITYCKLPVYAFLGSRAFCCLADMSIMNIIGVQNVEACKQAKSTLDGYSINDYLY
jgi:hypothetical protein